MKAAPSPQLVQSAAAAIYLAWLPLIGEAAAREQAQAFANRFQLVPRRVPATSGKPANAAP
jgi:hypothetical protein